MDASSKASLGTPSPSACFSLSPSILSSSFIAELFPADKWQVTFKRARDTSAVKILVAECSASAMNKRADPHRLLFRESRLPARPCRCNKLVHAREILFLLNAVTSTILGEHLFTRGKREVGTSSSNAAINAAVRSEKQFCADIPRHIKGSRGVCWRWELVYVRFREVVLKIVNSC